MWFATGVPTCFKSNVTLAMPHPTYKHTCTNARTHTHTHTPHTHTQTHTRTRTRIHTLTSSHAHTRARLDHVQKSTINSLYMYIIRYFASDYEKNCTRFSENQNKHSNNKGTVVVNVFRILISSMVIR